MNNDPAGASPVDVSVGPLRPERKDNMIQRIRAAWKALMGQPIYATLPPARLLELQDGDRVLLECDRHLSREQHRQLTEYMRAWLIGAETRAAVLSGGVRLVAVRKRPNLEPTGRPGSR